MMISVPFPAASLFHHIDFRRQASLWSCCGCRKRTTTRSACLAQPVSISQHWTDISGGSGTGWHWAECWTLSIPWLEISCCYMLMYYTWNWFLTGFVAFPRHHWCRTWYCAGLRWDIQMSPVASRFRAVEIHDADEVWRSSAVQWSHGKPPGAGRACVGWRALVHNRWQFSGKCPQSWRILVSIVAPNRWIQPHPTIYPYYIPVPLATRHFS